MSVPQLAQLTMLAQVDELVTRLSRWSEAETPWEPLQYCRAVVRQLLGRVDACRVRLEAPLLVATFGGTGTGKSTLVNALVGHECTASGRERPTTLLAVVVAHPETDLEALGLPLDEMQVVRRDAGLLRDVVIIDCPDPDTTEAETPGSNLARVHRLLPFCDVLLYTTTQQKYRSARVTGELAAAARGCRLVFVQTCADLDSDIREDWRRQLADNDYHVPDLFLIDSLRALREQQAGQRPTGDFALLLELLSTQLAASQRTQIRRANLVDLVHDALEHCREHIDRSWPAVLDVEAGLDEQNRRVLGVLAASLRDELQDIRSLWERRLLDAVTQRWGFSPFAGMLRVYNSLGAWVAWAGLFRARSSAQMALIGAVQGARWVLSKQQEQSAEERLERIAALGLDAPLIQETRLVVAGYARQARLAGDLVDGGSLDRLGQEAVRVEDCFLGDAARQIDAIISELAHRRSGLSVRWRYEAPLAALLAYVVIWPGWNFFYLHPWRGQPLISVDFYIHGGIFLALLSAGLVMLFARRLRAGLDGEITAMAGRLAQGRVSSGLFPELARACREIRRRKDDLEALAAFVAEIRPEISRAAPLGARIAPPKAELPAPARTAAVATHR